MTVPLITYSGEDFKEAIMAKLNTNIVIQRLWENITKDVGNKEFTDKLTIKILKKWFNI